MLNKYSLMRKEEYPLPSSPKGIVDLVARILDSDGAVHKIVVESDSGVLAYRDAPEDEFNVSVDLEGALRNATVLEYENSDPTPFESIVDVMGIMANEKVMPVCWVTGNDDPKFLGGWLKNKERGAAPTDAVDSLLSYPVIRVPWLADSTLILAGSFRGHASAQDVTLAVRVVMSETVAPVKVLPKEEPELRKEPVREKMNTEFAKPSPHKKGTTNWYPAFFSSGH